jgi:hypothetical protein
MTVNPNNNNLDAVYTTDEYGRPYVIVRDQGKKSRVSGLEAQKVIFFVFLITHPSQLC